MDYVNVKVAVAVGAIGVSVRGGSEFMFNVTEALQEFGGCKGGGELHAHVGKE